MIIRYKTSTLTRAGWRSVRITAEADQVAEKWAVVTSVLDIEGNGATGYASITGTKRQSYCADHISQREIGKRKLIRYLEIMEEERPA